MPDAAHAEGVPEISRGSSEDRERLPPENVSDKPLHPEGVPESNYATAGSVKC